MSGAYPKKDNEIALDRVFAKNNHYKNNDTIKIAGKKYTITGMVALPDYSCLFSDNADMMFDSVNFGVAVMTDKALTQLDQNKLTYNYAWYYQKEPKDDAAQKKMSDRFLEKLTKKVIVTSYVPRYAMHNYR